MLRTALLASQPLRITAVRTLAGGCGGGAAPPPPKKKSVLELFKNLGSKKDPVEQRTKNDPHSRALLGIDDDQDYQGAAGHSHGEHARALENDLRAKLIQQNHGHSHGDDHGHGHTHGDRDDHGHGHSHGEGEDHGHSHGAHGHSHNQQKTISIEESEDDFVEMWNHNAPAGPEHGGPRGPEPTRYGQEWEKKGRVSDFN